ncbi:hypothetical protein QFC21_004991 [Naganishia friedmannii]|uniref:Uncharacterized protein n=1 Tax=Naganishia friedmannii TaxID=89922 RepID=A0ACC2VCZ7_9TREE|nr:hypothetical protein QFC21_004991 [Naganishia friedmannii]
MVSFQCDGCGDTIKKPQLDKHRNRCWATFSCIDCSTTFHGTDYKSHTSCISEAEKYQGALYKGKKAGGHAGNNSTAKPETTNGRYQPYPTSKPIQQEETPGVTEFETATPAPETTAATPAAPAIHPSRTALLNGGAVNSRRERPARSAFPNLHPGANYPPPMPYGRNAGRQQVSTKVWATGMNGVAGEAPMRSWGGSPAPEEGEDAINGSGNGMVQEASTSTPMMVDVEKKKKKKKKGDKGGTGSRANSSALKRATTAEAEVPASTGTTDQGDAVKVTAEAPAVIIPATPMASEAQHTRPEGDSKKKRKAEAEADEEPTTAGEASSSSSSSKTAKKLRKALQSIATSSKQSSSSSVPLATLIEKISGEMSKKKKSSEGGVIDATGITRDIKVKFVEGSNGQEGQWVLEV